jgi:hypothetical protein
MYLVGLLLFAFNVWKTATSGAPAVATGEVDATA